MIGIYSWIMIYPEYDESQGPFAISRPAFPCRTCDRLVFCVREYGRCSHTLGDQALIAFL